MGQMVLHEQKRRGRLATNLCMHYPLIRLATDGEHKLWRTSAGASRPAGVGKLLCLILVAAFGGRLLGVGF